MNKYSFSFVMGITVTILFTNITVFAGNINDNESTIIGIVTRYFEQSGVTYKVKDKYIDAAMEYSNQDDIDLTDTQRDKAIAAIYSNIETGIESGYLEPVILDSNNSGDNKINSNAGKNSGDGNHIKGEETNKNSKNTIQQTQKHPIISQLELRAEENDKEIIEIASNLDVYIRKSSISSTFIYIVTGGLWSAFLVVLYVAVRFRLFYHSK